jgi:hypothetical protein
MKKKLIAIGIGSLVLLGACTTAQLQSALNTASTSLGDTKDVTTEGDVVSGLKEALTRGITKGSNQASKENGYYKDELLKVLMPPELKKADTKLRQLGFNKLMDDFELSLNRGAEGAAAEAKPIFVDAIKAMTVKDAWNILKGKENAATTYLRTNTESKLRGSFKPVISKSLDNVGATKYYTEIATRYNKIPLVTKVEADLPEYTTNKAIDGLFILIQKEEKNIRANPVARVSDLLKKVFTPENMGK